MTKILTFCVTDEFHGKRLDAALSALYPDRSRSVITQFIQNGMVELDGKKVIKPSLKVSSGQNVKLEIPEENAVEAKPQDLPLDVVYEDEDLIVINKPAGFVVHPGAGVPDGTVMNAVLFRYPQTAALPRAGIVHRLDKDTSGLMVIALSQLAQIKLTRAISKHNVVREYEAVAEGLITAGGTIEGDIARDPTNRTRMAVVPDGMGREAVTHYRVMEQFRAHTLLRLRLETGRTHQIRVHLASIDHPLIGDPQYGRGLRILKGSSDAFANTLRSFRRQALHAAHIEFKHPASGENLSFDAPRPKDFEDLIEALRQDKKDHPDEY